jgi:hypothetical protein
VISFSRNFECFEVLAARDSLDLVGQDHRILAQIPVDIGDQAQLPFESLDLPDPQVSRQDRNTTQDRRRRRQTEARS